MVWSLRYSICTFFCVGKCSLIRKTERQLNDERGCDEAMNKSKKNTEWEMMDVEGCDA